MYRTIYIHNYENSFIPRSNLTSPLYLSVCFGGWKETEEQSSIQSVTQAQDAYHIRGPWFDLELWLLSVWSFAWSSQVSSYLPVTCLLVHWLCYIARRYERVCVCDGTLVSSPGKFSCSQDRLWIHYDPVQDKENKRVDGWFKKFVLFQSTLLQYRANISQTLDKRQTILVDNVI